MDESTRKVCTKCGAEKALEDFHPARAGKFGRRADCKECRTAAEFAKWVTKRDAQRAAKKAARAAASASLPPKTCIICGEIKPRLEFYELTRSPDGRHPRCRDCFTAARRKRRDMTDADRAAEVEALKSRATKACSACGDDKPRAEFRSTKASRDGMVAACKACEATWHRDHYAKVRELRLEQSREWYEANRERKNEAARRWRQAHPERIVEANHRRRARVLGTTVGEVRPEDLWDGRCALCDDELVRALRWPDPMSPSLDHIVPLSKGGTHEQRNLQWAHLRCNQSKGARLPESA